MDMRKYAASHFIGPKDVEGAPITKRIQSVKIGKLNKPVLHFDDESQFTLSGPNVTALGESWGWDATHWLNCEVQLRHGSFIDKQDSNKVKPKVDVVPISIITDKPKMAPSKDSMDDEIPF